MSPLTSIHFSLQSSTTNFTSKDFQVESSTIEFLLVTIPIRELSKYILTSNNF